MNVVDMLTLLAEIVDSVQRSVEHLEAGERASGVSGLERCIERLEKALDGCTEPSEAERLPEPEELGVRDELEAVLQDLRAAKDILTAAPSRKRER